MDKNELQEQIKVIYSMISSLSVSGDVVDTIAAVRVKLRKLNAMIDKLEIKAPEKEDDNG